MLQRLSRGLVQCQVSRHATQCGSWRNLHETSSVGPTTDARKPPIPPPIPGKEAKEIQIPVPWGHISGKWWGRTDVQPVILLHGWQDNAGSFNTLVPLLHNEALLAIENVGHGTSSHYPLGQSYSYVDGIVNLRRVIKYFGWKKSVSLIGHSMGSLTAFGYAGIFPDGVDKLVNIDDIRGALIPTLLPVSKDLRKVVEANLSYERKLSSEIGSLPSYSYEDIVDLYWKGCNGSITRDSAEILLERGILKASDDEKYSFSRDPRWKVFSWDIMSEDALYAMSSQITCEVLTIRARESFTNDPKAVELFEKTLKIVEKTAKKLESHVVEGTHHVHLNNPERVAPIINKFFDTVDRVICKWWGSDKIQPLLCLHGWQDNAATWDRLAPLMPNDISLLAMDFPGHGLSSHFHPGRSYHFLEYISFIRRVVNHYGWEKVSFLSHSMGSIASFVYACSYPELVDKYIGIDAMKPYSHNPVKSIRSVGKIIDSFISMTEHDPKKTPTYTYSDAQKRLVGASKGSLTPEIADLLLVRGLMQMPDGRYKYTRDPRLKVQQLMNWTHETILDLASNIKCSVCIINANPGLVYDKPEKHQDVYDVVLKSSKRFELHFVDGTHHIHLSNPKSVLPIVVDFLRK